MATNESGRTPEKAATLLVVDDTPDNLAVLGELLGPLYRVLAATSGERAVEIAQGQPKPDLILLDVMMPGMDGRATLARLQESPATADIPVIFVTALDSASDEERGLLLGAVDYIAKPFHPAIVLARVRTQLELKFARDRLSHQNAFLEAEVSRRLKEQEAIQAQLMQSEKLALIGQLVAGVAHEINNPISFVYSNLGSLEGYLRDVLTILEAYEALERAVEGQGPMVEEIARLKQEKEFEFIRGDLLQLIAECREGLERVRTLVKDLKDHARIEESGWTWAELHQGIESTLHIVWNELKYKSTVKREFGALPLVWCIPSRINQVFMNLLVNAAQAITDQGEITIRTSHHGEEVWVEVADTGVGIPPEHLGRIFEPFFTTKPAGHGTGLGLSLVQNIVHQHHGRMEVESEPGKGSTFRVILPVNPQEAERQQPAPCE